MIEDTARKQELLLRSLTALFANRHSLLINFRANDFESTETTHGPHDFDFEIGLWKTKLRRLVRPLSGSTIRVEYEGTSNITKVLDGRANLVELEVSGPSGLVEGLSLRLYHPESRQWSLNFANINSGMLTPQTIGEFKPSGSSVTLG